VKNTFWPYRGRSILFLDSSFHAHHLPRR